MHQRNVEMIAKQGDDLIVCEQGRMRVGRWIEIAYQVRNGYLLEAGNTGPAHCTVHPSAAALVRARVEIREDSAHALPSRSPDVEVTDIAVPHARGRRFANLHTKQSLDDFEQPLQHTGQREVVTAPATSLAVMLLPVSP